MSFFESKPGRQVASKTEAQRAPAFSQMVKSDKKADLGKQVKHQINIEIRLRELILIKKKVDNLDLFPWYQIIYKRGAW